MRLDQLLVQQAFFESRQKAQEAVLQGAVQVNGVTIQKVSYLCHPSDKLNLLFNPWKYVSRGGFKLELALKTFLIDCHGKRALDIGASTGGFTDCLLQHGASQVYAIDVGQGQLHATLKSDPRVHFQEKCSFQELPFSFLDHQKVDLVVADLSFTSAIPLFDSLDKWLKESGDFILLIKPQFEMESRRFHKGGIIKDPKVHQQAIEKIQCAAAQSAWKMRGIVPTANGQERNQEFLTHWV